MKKIILIFALAVVGSNAFADADCPLRASNGLGATTKEAKPCFADLSVGQLREQFKQGTPGAKTR